MFQAILKAKGKLNFLKGREVGKHVPDRGICMQLPGDSLAH